MDMQTQIETTRFQFMAQLSSLKGQLEQAAELAERYHALIQHMPNLGSMPALNFAPNVPPIATQQHSGPGRKRKAVVEDEDELTDGRRRRRKKKERLPDQPKRPASAYLFFQNEVRNSLKELYPKTPHHELLGLISKQWADMSSENRKPYEDKQKVAKELFDTQMTAFNLKHGIEPKAVAARKGAPVAQAAGSDVASEDGEGEEIEVSEQTSDVEDAVEPEHEEEVVEEEEEEEEEEATPEPPKPVKTAKPPSKAVKEEKRPKKEKKVKA